jgi:hypothetical protein
MNIGLFGKFITASNRYLNWTQAILSREYRGLRVKWRCECSSLVTIPNLRQPIFYIYVPATDNKEMTEVISVQHLSE